MWDKYWSSLTADDDRAPWDTEPDEHAGVWCDSVGKFVVPDLPMLDLGCGSGLHSWWLAERFAGTVPEVVGVDVAPSAVARARRWRPPPGRRAAVSFAVADLLDRAAVESLAERIGPANVWLRMVLHTLASDEQRATAIGHLGLLTAGRGVILNYELVRQDEDHLAVMRLRHKRLGRMFPVSAPPGAIERGGLGDLYRSCGLRVLAHQQDHTSFLPLGAEAPLPCEWVVATNAA